MLQSKKETEDDYFTEFYAFERDIHSTNSTLRKNSKAQEADRKDLSSSCCVCAQGFAANINQKRLYILEN